MRQLTKSVVRRLTARTRLLAYQAEKQLSDLGDKVPAADKTKVEGLVKDLREAIAKDDDERIKTLMPELQQALFAALAATSTFHSSHRPEQRSRRRDEEVRILGLSVI